MQLAAGKMEELPLITLEKKSYCVPLSWYNPSDPLSSTPMEGTSSRPYFGTPESVPTDRLLYRFWYRLTVCSGTSQRPSTHLVVCARLWIGVMHEFCTWDLIVPQVLVLSPCDMFPTLTNTNQARLVIRNILSSSFNKKTVWHIEQSPVILHLLQVHNFRNAVKVERSAPRENKGKVKVCAKTTTKAKTNKL